MRLYECHLWQIQHVRSRKCIAWGWGLGPRTCSSGPTLNTVQTAECQLHSRGQAGRRRGRRHPPIPTCGSSRSERSCCKSFGHPRGNKAVCRQSGPLSTPPLDLRTRTSAGPRPRRLGPTAAESHRTNSSPGTRGDLRRAVGSARPAREGSPRCRRSGWAATAWLRQVWHVLEIGTCWDWAQKGVTAALLSLS